MTDAARTSRIFGPAQSPFAIALRPLSGNSILEVDDRFECYLKEKQRLYREKPDAVFRFLPESLQAQREARDCILDDLARHHPRRQRETTALPRPDPPGPAQAEAAPLWQAASRIQEDLAIMQRAPDGWRLTAGAICFPSSWLLADKIGLVMADIHRPVPGFGPDTRHAGLIERIFDNLHVGQPVERANWSIYPDAMLFHPPLAFKRLSDKVETLFLRVERQTLTKLPETGAILFTIGIFVAPLPEFPYGGSKPLAKFRNALSNLTQDQLAYKNIADRRDALVEFVTGQIEKDATRNTDVPGAY